MKKSVWLACGLSFAVGAAACNGTADDSDNTTARTDAGVSGAAATAGNGMLRVADVVANPNDYFGRTVTLEAEVEEVFGPRAFALDEDAPFAGGIDNDLLVLSKAAASLADIDDQWLNDRVRVTGTVGRLSVIEVERELGWDLDPELEIELEGAGAVLIASSVTRVQSQGQDDRGGDRSQQARADLPDTASWFPLAGVIGLLSMGGALGIRFVRRG